MAVPDARRHDDPRVLRAAPAPEDRIDAGRPAAPGRVAPEKGAGGKAAERLAPASRAAGGPVAPDEAEASAQTSAKAKREPRGEAEADTGPDGAGPRQGKRKTGKGAPGGKGKGAPNGRGKARKRARADAQDNPQAPYPQMPHPHTTPPDASDPQRTAGPARMRTRHWGLIASFVALVLAPFALVVWYLWAVALDQYASVTGFTVRQEEGGSASQLLGGLAQLAGSQGGADGEILYEFILSQSLVRQIDSSVGLRDHYGARWEADPVFALWPDPSIEDLERHWRRVVRVSYDPNTGLTELRVLAFDPETAQAIAREVVHRSQDMINALNERAREDAMRYARADLEQAVARLKSAREALTAFRTRTRIVDPAADIQGRMGVMNNLQQQLAEALIEYDLVRETAAPSDPRVTQAQRRIAVIRDRIADERASFATSGPTSGRATGQASGLPPTSNTAATPDRTPGPISGPTGGADPGANSGTDRGADDYPSLIAEYEGLVVDREFAEETYRAALAALDAARAGAQRQSRYLATYVDPTLAEEPGHPRRAMLAGVIGLVLLLAWAVMTLIFYAVRDRA